MKKILASALIAMVAGGAFGNSVLNPGFETAGGEAWQADQWAFGSGGGVYRNDANPRTGDWHLSIDFTRDPAAAQTVLGLSAWAGLSITASAWIDVVGGTSGNVYFGANQRDASAAFISNHESGQFWNETGGYVHNPTLNFTGAANLDRVELYFKTDEVSQRRFDIDDVSLTSPTPIPEPATMSLLGLGALAMVLRRKMKK